MRQSTEKDSYRVVIYYAGPVRIQPGEVPTSLAGSTPALATFLEYLII